MDKEALMKIGVSCFFTGSYSNAFNSYYSPCYENLSEEDKSYILKSILFHPKFAKDWFEGLGHNEKLSAMSFASKNIPGIYNMGDSWQGIIDKYTTTDIDVSSILAWRSDSIAVKAASLNPEYDWSILFSATIVDNVGSISYVSPSLAVVLDCYSELYRDEFYNYVYKNAKNHTWELRAELYKRIVTSGSLTYKMARRIRSDSSSRASAAGLRAFVENVSMYPNSSEYFIKFIDTNHQDVAIILARSVPDEMLTYMMGTSCSHAKTIVRNRIKEIERKKDELEASKNF